MDLYYVGSARCLDCGHTFPEFDAEEVMDDDGVTYPCCPECSSTSLDYTPSMHEEAVEYYYELRQDQRLGLGGG